MFFNAAIASATDRVVVLSGESRSKIAVSGTILDYTGGGITLQTRQGNSITYPREEIVEVGTDYLAVHQRGTAELAARRFTAVRPLLVQALEAEGRVWVRRQILSQLIQVDLALGDMVAATSDFAAIVQSDPETVYADHAPLNWNDLDLSAELRSRCAAWLKSDQILLRLVAASHLLRDDRLGDEAASELQQIVRSSALAARTLAQAQLWRLRLFAPELTTTEVARWEETVLHWPDPMQAGGWYLVGRGYAKHEQWAEAAAAWLRLPLTFPFDERLSAEAGLRAGQALESAGDLPAARTVLREIATRYADTPYGPDARAWLETHP